MERRDFMKKTVAVAATAGMAIETLAENDSNASNKAKFNLKYAPNFGAFPQMGGKKSAAQGGGKKFWRILGRSSAAGVDR